MTRTRWFIVIALIGGITVGVAVCEALLRVATPPWLGGRMAELNPRGNNKFRGFGTDVNWAKVLEQGTFRKFVPLSECRVWHYEYDTVAHIDEWGGRRTVDPKALVSKALLPFVGDSVTFGVGVADEETFASILGEKLGIKTLNLGEPGSNLVRQKKVIEMRHEELGAPPLYVIPFFLGNDILDFNKEAASLAGKADGTQEGRLLPVLRRINDAVYHSPLFKKSYLIQLIRMPLMNMYNKLTGKMAMNPIYITMDSSKEAFVRANVAKGLEVDLRDLVEFSRARKFTFVVLLIPDLNQVYANRRNPRVSYYALDPKNINPDLPNTMVTDLLRSYGVVYLDLTDGIRAHSDNPGLYYIQDDHPTPAGQRLIAELTYPFLKKIIPESGN